MNQNPTSFDEQAMRFLEAHDTSILSTLSPSNTIHSTPVYYIFQNNVFYILTKYGTAKMENIQQNPTVNLSLYDQATLESIEVHGTAEIEGDASIKDSIFTTMLDRHTTNGRLNSLPITTIRSGGYTVLRITPNTYTYTNFDA